MAAVRLMFLLLSLLTAACGLVLYGWPMLKNAGAGLNPAVAGQASPVGYPVGYEVAEVPAGAPKLSILFVGNSYTFVNDLPLMLRAIAADAKNPEDIQTGEAVHRGARLLDTWEDGTARALLASRQWNYVVLQEQSTMAMQPADQATARAGFLAWGQAAHAVGALPVVYETWARQPGAAGDAGGAMQAQIDYVLGAAAGSINATIVPAGDAWARCETKPNAPLLYAPDGAHPSLAGTYLTALLFYRILTGNSPADSHYVPPGLDAGVAGVLRGCAA